MWNTESPLMSHRTNRKFQIIFLYEEQHKGV